MTLIIWLFSFLNNYSHLNNYSQLKNQSLHLKILSYQLANYSY